MKRRDFLRVVALGAITARFGDVERLFADDSIPLDPTIVAIFSDPHLHGPETSQYYVRFKQGIAKVLAMNPRPANLLVYGDVAFDHGEREDYVLFRELIKPLEDAGIHWEVAMGNHDRIAVFRDVFPERFEKPQPIDNRYINVVETPNADFILLDSYLENEVAGSIIPEQKEWLVEKLKSYEKKPVFVGCHHHLKDTKIADLLKPCPKFVAYLHGHLHFYRNPRQEDIATLCFPSLGCWGDLGFVVAHVSETEAIFTPDIDAYQWPKWNPKKDPVDDLEPYLAQLNANSPVFQLP